MNFYVHIKKPFNKLLFYCSPGGGQGIQYMNGRELKTIQHLKELRELFKRFTITEDIYQTIGNIPSLLCSTPIFQNGKLRGFLITFRGFNNLLLIFLKFLDSKCSSVTRFRGFNNFLLILSFLDSKYVDWGGGAVFLSDDQATNI